ncbi:hypothetical protein WOLCODRAFT_137255 [Wolfiporia cocos MD-104 SS10]|uniref:Uncharacterized protein n=1 Tax=Wolfiporia cocos (strain MD-104) TaxID=742152 RepID=A0A2H3JI24_WOLCO|nr:hypothetical protein WOLCODRAFT_137255 [Wolfiporia cocos MD-104 SS10]
MVPAADTPTPSGLARQPGDWHAGDAPHTSRLTAAQCGDSATWVRGPRTECGRRCACGPTPRFPIGRTFCG